MKRDTARHIRYKRDLFEIVDGTEVATTPDHELHLAHFDHFTTDVAVALLMAISTIERGILLRLQLAWN